MPRRQRVANSPGYFHVTNRRAGRGTLFHSRSDYRAFIEIVDDGLAVHPVPLVAYCLMPNHWHFVMGPVDPHGLSRLMHWVTMTHAVRWHHHRRSVGLGPVYQNRFWSGQLSDADHFVSTCRYVERNALAAKLVPRAQDWPWSSIAERLQQNPRLPIAKTPFLLSPTWLEFVNTPRASDERADEVFHILTPVPLTVENSRAVRSHRPDARRVRLGCGAAR
jgi:putative transposase